MSMYDSADLLQRLFGQIRRPLVDETFTPVQAYQALTDAQQAVYEDIMTRAPFAMIGPPTLLTTVDGGQTYQFGTDANGDAIVPMGKVGIYPSVASVPDYPWTLGVDYLDEGSQIRIPNGRTATPPLYWRGVLPPPAISATSQPTLRPASARVLLVYWAAAEYASLGNLRSDDQATYRAKYTEGLGRALLRLKTEFVRGPAAGSASVSTLRLAQGNGLG